MGMYPWEAKEHRYHDTPTPFRDNYLHYPQLLGVDQDQHWFFQVLVIFLIIEK